MKEVQGRGGESIRPWNRTCAKYKGLKHRSVLGSYEYFSLTAGRAWGEEGQEAGESGRRTGGM